MTSSAAASLARSTPMRSFRRDYRWRRWRRYGGDGGDGDNGDNGDDDDERCVTLSSACSSSYSLSTRSSAATARIERSTIELFCVFLCVFVGVHFGFLSPFCYDFMLLFLDFFCFVFLF